MNFADTPDEAAFRAKARAWLGANAPHELEPMLRASDFGHTALKSESMLSAARAWQRRKFDAQWACIGWPEDCGGTAARPIEQVIWSQEEGIFGGLSGIFAIGHGMCGPTLMAHADEATRGRYVPAIASGEAIWCQLFSEPAGGSDLAALRTAAEHDGDGWIIRGQKVWTSYAQYADYGLLLARSDPNVPKHAGLTMFFVDMRSPGVETRPIRQANGASEFNEVFFDEVRIPDAQRLGNVGDGWKVALTTLMNERLAVARAMPTGVPEMLDFLSTATCSGAPALADAQVRARIADWAVRALGLRYTAFRTISALSKGVTPGPENAIGKVVIGAMLQEMAAFALDIQGPAGVLTAPGEAPAHGAFQGMLLRSPAIRIEGGTDEILRNILAERVLGLPADLRADKGMPFRDIPAATITERGVA